LYHNRRSFLQLLNLPADLRVQAATATQRFTLQLTQQVATSQQPDNSNSAAAINVLQQLRQNLSSSGALVALPFNSSSYSASFTPQNLSNTGA
jgi:hypothetical protein